MRAAFVRFCVLKPVDRVLTNPCLRRRLTLRRDESRRREPI